MNQFELVADSSCDDSQTSCFSGNSFISRDEEDSAVVSANEPVNSPTHPASSGASSSSLLLLLLLTARWRC